MFNGCLGYKLDYTIEFYKVYFPETNIAPENRPKPKRKVRLPTIHFQVQCNALVSVRDSESNYINAIISIVLESRYVDQKSERVNL